MGLKERIARAESQLPGTECPVCHGAALRIREVDESKGEVYAEPEPCAGCGEPQKSGGIHTIIVAWPPAERPDRNLL
ncbi:MAG TPA: hypothetical protein VNO70_15790 [Blastocatellia bacterium]|nr:hypothetical protein [Blastocatellia bacterium]